MNTMWAMFISLWWLLYYFFQDSLKVQGVFERAKQIRKIAEILQASGNYSQEQKP